MGILAASVNLLPDGTFFFQLAVFGIAVGIMSWGIFGPVTRVLDLRKQKTVGDSSEATELLARAEVIATQYADTIRDAKTSAKEVKEDLRQQGFAQATEIMTAARQDCLKELEAARKSIAGQVDTARKALSDEANAFALTIVGKLALQDFQGSEQKKILEENGAQE